MRVRSLKINEDVDEGSSGVDFGLWSTISPFEEHKHSGVMQVPSNFPLK